MSSLTQAEKTAPKVNPCDQEDKFIDEFRESLGKGLGFLPLVGAGLSAPSGVPIFFEIQEYLTKCIVMALGLCRKEGWTATIIAGPVELCQKFFRCEGYRRLIGHRQPYPAA